MKILALDPGDVWTGTALTDRLGMFAHPYKTIKTKELDQFLITLFAQETITQVVVGYPKTMRGTKSLQTEKIERLKEKLEQDHPTIEWILWDERLSSKRASTIKRKKTKEDKIASHSIAAAFILDSYLQYRQSAIQ